jgi:hypothetical protein
MAAFIENPRRAPRLPVRCDARIALRSGGFFISCTWDVSPGGCGVAAAPSRVAPGERVFFEVDHEGVRYRFTGSVAWSSTEAPWRAGIAFDQASLATAAELFGRISEAHPEASRGVDRIPEDAVLARTPVPGTLPTLPRQAEILLAIGSGVEARALRERLGTDWDRSVNAVFALLESGAIEASAPASTPQSAAP